MHVILKKNVEELANYYEFTESSSVLFEFFCNYCIVSKSFLGRFSPKAVTTKDDDASIDGIAFIIDGDLITTKDDAKEVFESHKTSIDTKLILVQSKSGELFKKDDISNFNMGIKDFLSLDPKLPNGELNKKSIDIFNVILNNLKKVKNKLPSIEVYYCTSGNYSEEREIKASFEIIEREIEETELFHSSKVIPLGRSELLSLWNSITQTNEAKLKLIEFFGMPPMPEIPQSYVALVNAKEFVDKVLTDSNGNIKNDVFEENIRAYLGETEVNKDIAQTLNDSNKNKLFSVLNNGITIVTPELTLTPNSKEIDLVNYQIINGCQTSNTLFNHYGKLTEDINIVIKCIESADNDNITSIISATNSQTSIPPESFFSLLEKTKLIYEFFEIQNDSDDSGGKIYFERREGQFKNQSYPYSRIFDIKLLCRAYNAMFLDSPHNSARYPAKIFQVQKDNLFKDNDHEAPYYVSALTLYRYNALVNARKINAGNYVALKWHILELFKYVVHRKVENIRPNSNKINRYCQEIISVLHNRNYYEKLFSECFYIIDTLPIPSRDVLKRTRYSQQLIDATKSYLQNT